MGLSTGDDIAIFHPWAAEPPVSNGMHQTDVNATTPRPALAVTATEAAASADITTTFSGIIPSSYGGEALDCIVSCSNTTTSGNVLFAAELERSNGADMTTDHFSAQVKSSATTVPGTANTEFTVSIVLLTLPASLAKGDRFRLRLSRPLSDTNDTNTGESDIYQVRIAVH